MLSKQQFEAFLLTLPYPPNPFQLAILNEVAFGKGNLAIKAVAGSGKTSTLLMLVQLFKVMGVDKDDVILQAFNNAIAKELNHRIEDMGFDYKASTSHTLGKRILDAASKTKMQIEERRYNKIDKYTEIAEGLIQGKKKVSTFLATATVLCMGSLIDTSDKDEVVEFLDRQGHFLLDAEWQEAKGLKEDDIPLLLDAIHACVKQGIKKYEKDGVISFVDMLYMPYHFKKSPASKANWVLVDECQDLSKLQVYVAKTHLKVGGRIIVVGDPRQAIYGFAGADSQSFNNLVKEFNCRVFDLNTTYRSAVSIVNLAKRVVPELEAKNGALQGSVTLLAVDGKDAEKVSTTAMPLIKQGTMVLCRTKSPLIGLYFKTLAERGKNTNGHGKVILAVGGSSDAITMHLNGIAKLEGFKFEDFSLYLDLYKQKKTEKMQTWKNAETAIADLNDACECIQVCFDNFDGLDSVKEFKERMDELIASKADFDNERDILLSSVHSAKGLEAHKVIILHGEKLPLVWKKQHAWQYEQELNLKYVAITRAKQELVVLCDPKALPLWDANGSDWDNVPDDDDVYISPPSDSLAYRPTYPTFEAWDKHTVYELHVDKQDRPHYIACRTESGGVVAYVPYFAEGEFCEMSADELRDLTQQLGFTPCDMQTLFPKPVVNTVSLSTDEPPPYFTEPIASSTVEVTLQVFDVQTLVRCHGKEKTRAMLLQALEEISD